MKKVFVQLESRRGFGCDLQKGIHEYNNQFSNWEVILEPAYYLKSSKSTSVSNLISLMKPDGCILENIVNISTVTKLKIPFIRVNSESAYRVLYTLFSHLQKTEAMTTLSKTESKYILSWCYVILTSREWGWAFLIFPCYHTV